MLSPASFLTAALVGVWLTSNSEAKPILDILLPKPPICTQIADAISSESDVYYPGHSLYYKDIHHWASSSSQDSLCSVEPGTTADVGKILQILGSTRTPFAVKGGGHASNPAFSSTDGVQIAMYRFSEVTYDASTKTVVIGAGLIWDDVYKALEPYGVNVIGGRVTGVGVAGFTLGGGYSWKSNQYGLTVDTVTAFELVKPNGHVENVTAASNPDLFFALKGGFNNFGIVTRFTLKTFPQSEVWGGLITYTANTLDRVNAATNKFSTEVTDPKASIITTYNFLAGSPGVSQLLFYDAPELPAGIFDDFLDIPHLTKNVRTRSFISLVQSAPANITTGARAIFDTVSVVDSYTTDLLEAVINETVFWGTRLGLKSGYFFSYDVEPFLHSTYLSQPSASAFPPSRALNIQPLNIFWAWKLPLWDDTFHAAVQQSAQRLREVAGQGAVAGSRYPNYAIFNTRLEDMYGAENVQKLKAIKRVVDPGNVMSLSGGFKF